MHHTGLLLRNCFRRGTFYPLIVHISFVFYYSCIGIWTTLQNWLPNIVIDLFITNDEIHAYPTTQSSKLHVTRSATCEIYRCVQNRRVPLWNSLSNRFKNQVRLSSFKSNLRQFLIDSDQHIATVFHCYPQRIPPVKELNSEPWDCSLIEYIPWLDALYTE